MSRARLCLVLMTSAFVAGCAGQTENLTPAATAAAPGIATVAAIPTASPAATAAVATAPGSTSAAAPDGVTVVDGNQLAARTADTLLCRDMLVRGSNQMRRMCGTAAQWKDYQRREAAAAAEQVRRMQRGIPEDPADWRRRR